MTAFDLMANHDAEMEDLMNSFLAQVDGEESEETTSTTSEDCLTLPSSTHEQSVSIMTTTTKTKKPYKSYRKRSFNVAFIPALRILKRDIRRRYIDMFNNVINSHDNQLFCSFIDEFYRPECKSAHFFPDNVPPCFRSLEINGIDLLKRTHMINTVALPDSVIQMFNAKICKRLDEKGSRIMGSFHAQGTAIYLPKMYNGVPVDRNDSISQYCVNPMDLVYVEDFMSHLQLAATPMMMQLSGTFEMILDEEHRFVSACILCNDIKISQLIS